MTTVVDAFTSDGSAGTRAYLSDIGHFRASNVWTIAMAFRRNTAAPPEGGTLLSLRAAINEQPNHALLLDEVNLRAVYTYGSNPEAATPDASAVGATWYGIALTSDGSLTVTLRLFLLADGSLISTTTGVAGSDFFDSQTQVVSFLADYFGGNTYYHYAGRITLPLFVRGTALSAGQLAAYFLDPLNQGDSLVATLGSQVTWFDNTHLDRGPGAETISFTGAAAWGTGNGPSVPDRAAGNEMTATTGLIRITGSASLTEVLPPAIGSAGTFGIFYSGEQRVSASGSNLGGSAPLVHLSNDSTGVANMEAQVVRAFGDTSFTFDCLIDANSPGPLYLWVTNQTVGHPAYGGRDSAQFDVRADPGPSVVVLRRTAPAINAPINVAIAPVATAPEFYARHAQEVVTYSVSAGSLPPGVSLNTATGALTGTISASAGPSYSATLRATDPNGSFAEQTVTFSLGGGASAIGTRFFLRGVRR